MGIKENLRKESSNSRAPSFAASFYVELPTGDASQQLGSGLSDYWLNLIAQKSLSSKTRITGNLGYLFAGNTSTGALGIQTAQGHAYTGNGTLGKSQLQGMAGGQYVLRKGLSFCFGMLGSKYVPSPSFGGQIGFAIDFPDFFDSSYH